VLKRLLCRHPNTGLAFVRNIHGDEINFSGGNRSIWRCGHCGSYRYKAHLHK
jgi:hypothetical protein